MPFDQILDQCAALRRVLTSHPSETVRRLPEGAATCIEELPGGQRLFFVRDQGAMQRLARNPALDRGNGVHLLRSIFGPGTLFLMPHGKPHSRRGGEATRLLRQVQIDALTPEIAARACKAVEEVGRVVAGAPEAPVDMHDVILRYLFDVGARAITGVDVDLRSEVAVFRRGVDALHREATSMAKTALAANLPWTAAWMGKEARRAALEFHEAGRRMLVAGAARHGLEDTLALRALKRHGIDPAGVGESTVFPKEALIDAAMNLAASLFTTANLIERTLDHFQRHPDELRALRQMIDADFPTGAAGVSQLLLCPTLATLIPVMLAHSPVGIVSRDVVDATTFTEGDEDGAGTRHQLRRGDAVIFDVEGMQAQQVDGLRRQLGEDGRPALEVLNQRHDDVMKVFFLGRNRCPGRFLAVADSALFLIDLLSKFDCQSVERSRPLERGIVNRLGGSPLMRLTPVPPGEAPAAVSPP
ncbi:hypothetical protein PV762_22625 [Mitsuaria sp. CC2]|uniref:hypothetical protein n=1 Tax=Mitsuaria sp. CC2 TaxID=3029186 RepID=UPI003B8D425D